MILFKTFWKIVNKYKGFIMVYTVMLVIFGAINMSANDNNMDFTSSKPSISIINKDSSLVADNLENYMTDVSDVKAIDEDSIDDAIFYRDISYVIYIPSQYGDALFSENPLDIEIKSLGDYEATLANNLLERYLKVQKVYLDESASEEELIKSINATIISATDVKIKSKLDTSSVTRATSYYSFANYSIMAIVIFIICLVMSSFNDKNIRKRTIISSKSIKAYNFSILSASLLYGLIIFILVNGLAFILLGNVMFTLRGIIYMLNSLVFIFVSLTIALFISTLVRSKEAISGIINVIALGSSFLCGAFVPVSLLPDSVVAVAHLLPSYYYINSNDLLKGIEIINFSTLGDVWQNILIMFLFSLIFIILNNLVGLYKRRRAS